MPRAILTVTATVVATLVVLAFGVFLGGHPGLLPGPVRSAFVAESPSERTRDELFQEIGSSYYRPVDVERLRSDSLNAIVGGLHDQFSHYLAPREAQVFSQQVSGEFEGVGMSVQPDPKGLLVAEVFEGSPAERTGIRPKDVISAVNGKSIAGQPTELATAKIKGPPGTSVRLTVTTPKPKRRREIAVRRERIEVPVATGKVRRTGGTPLGVVRLTTFSTGAHAALREKVDEVLRKGAKGLVLDLRGNGGGLLNEGVLVSSIFIESGLVVSTDGLHKSRREFKAEGGAIDPKIPMVVLVDHGTASASEIVTGALRDRHRAVVAGERTFGKGVFQEVQTLSNGGALSLTVGEYFLPNGDNISRKGIVPTVTAPDTPRTRRDEALPKALKALGRRTG